MKTIYKFPLSITDEQTVSMPRGSQVLSVQMQNEQLNVWALVNTENLQEQRKFRIFGTGNPVDVDGNWKFVGTVQERMFVWHIFIEVV